MMIIALSLLYEVDIGGVEAGTDGERIEWYLCSCDTSGD